MIELIVWSASAVLGVIPTIGALSHSVSVWRAFDKTESRLRDLVVEELIREVIILGGQILVIGVAVLAVFSGPRDVIVWLLIPLPALFGLLSYHSNYARRRVERRLSP